MASNFTLDHRGDRSRRDNTFLQLHRTVTGLGEGSRIARDTAGALHRFDEFELVRPYHFVTPRGTNRQRVGSYVHTSLYLPPIDCEEVAGLPVTSPTRTLIDLAVDCDSDRLTVALDSALRDLKTTEEFLHGRIVDLRSRGRYGIPKLLAVIEGVEATRGAHSWLERRFLELCHTAGLPLPTPQRVMGRRDGRLIRVDCHFDDTPVVVELLGYRFHRSELQMRRDAERMNELLLRGTIVLQFAYRTVVEQPEHVIDTVVRALLPYGMTA